MSDEEILEDEIKVKIKETFERTGAGNSQDIVKSPPNFAF